VSAIVDGRRRWRRAGWAAFLLMPWLSLPAAAGPAPPARHLKVSGGWFHGPGQLPDTPLPAGLLGHVEFERPLQGATQYFNNGPEPPNIPGGSEIDGVVDGKLSNGQPFNERISGGIVEVGRGAMRFMVVIGFGGPNEGRENYTFGTDRNLHIRTDLILDPGFGEGIVFSRDLHITTGLLWVPASLQTRAGRGDGQDRAGSLPTGAPVLGRLGDEDGDGLLDGVIVGASNVPLGHMFTPGAPVVQTRAFTSDIPIASIDAAFATLAGIANYERLWESLFVSETPPAAREFMQARVEEYVADVARRLQSADRLLAVAAKEVAGLDAARTNVAEAIAAAAPVAPQTAIARASGVDLAFRKQLALARKGADRLEGLSALKGEVFERGVP
jgi:hypothetical protein